MTRKLSDDRKRDLAQFEKRVKEDIEQSTMIPQASKIPERYQGKTFINYDQTGRVKETAAAVSAIRKGRSVFITGECGTGKTHMGLGLIYEWCRENFTAAPRGDGVVVANYEANDVPVFAPMIEVLASIRHAMNTTKRDIDEEVILAEYLERPVLMLDDVGSEKATDWTRQVLYTIIDRIYRTNQQLILTTNLSLQQLAEVTDDRIASRLAEMCYKVTLKGPDRRLEKKK